jgi:predicted nucleic acid-binding Zn ribbon protein
MADCLWCGRPVPPDVDGEFCSTACGLRWANEAVEEEA